MASFYHYNTYHPSYSASHSNLPMTNHNNRNRRVNRLAQDSHKPQIRAVRKEEEPIIVTSFRQRFEAGRSFDLDDDLEFCPSLLTECDMISNQSTLSDRDSLSSESPNSSPQAYQVSPSFNYYSNPTPYLPTTQSNTNFIPKYKDDLPPSTRSRIAIHIVNPNAMNDSRSPERQAQSFERRW